ncbi:MAG: hypothetical protein HEP71_02610 [Roseivirga sp.]|nr:hypothetical protein [Roseivirga sp.]
MRILFKVLLLLLISQFTAFSQDHFQFKVYSHADFFNLITQETDTIFRLKDAFIRFDPQTDSLYFFKDSERGLLFKSTDTLTINIGLELENVHFEHQNDTDENVSVGFHHMIFNKEVQLINSSSFLFIHCIFNGALTIVNDGFKRPFLENLDSNYPNYDPEIHLLNNTIRQPLYLNIGEIENYSSIGMYVMENKFSLPDAKAQTEIMVNNIRETNIDDNQFHGKGFVNVFIDASNFTSVYRNQFNDFRVHLTKASWGNSQVYIFEENRFNQEVMLAVDNFSVNHVYRWDQWAEKTISTLGYNAYLVHLLTTGKNNSLGYEELFYSDTVFNNYSSSYKYQIEKSYKFEMQLLGQFYDFYKLQHDTDYANQVYTAFKNLETQRLKFLYKESPSFKGYFTWKINQFLRLFSAYGTEPARSIVFSLYVILAFAVVYLFFPNHWDSHGKNRIKDRFLFFHKYLRLNKGIHDVYMEGQAEEVHSYQSFRKVLDDHKDEVPSFFYRAAKPLLKWSTASTTIYSKILSRLDFLKGTWKETDSKVRGIKTALTIFIFVIALTYDLFIKVLNALMLSINTFTTLGFGEIPIKGLPRYLAIIQGFIGWFMLTIFSVSLISQLLN